MSHFTYPSKYSDMKPKVELFAKSIVTETSNTDYEGWQSQLEGNRWQQLSERLGEELECGLLRAMTVVGVPCLEWDDVSSAIYLERAPFQGFYKSIFDGTIRKDLTVDELSRDHFHYFARTISQKFNYRLKYPPLYPEWAEERVWDISIDRVWRRYNQSDYLRDIKEYWDDMDDAYYFPWPTTQFGKDSPAVARLRKIGDVARREIDLAGEHARHHIDIDDSYITTEQADRALDSLLS